MDARRRLIVAALAAAPAAAIAQRVPSRGIAGLRAPELRPEFWIDGEGRRTQFSLLAQRGRWVHLKFWQAWCPGCHAHGFPTLKKLTEAFRREPRVINVAVQTVFEGHSWNGPEKLREMQKRYGLEIVMGHDPGRRNADGRPSVMTDFRTGGTPWHVLVDPQGVVVHDGFGINPDKAVAFLRERLAHG